jgi:hypothetical protein
VRVDDPGHHELARGIDHGGAGRRLQALADARDLAVLQQQVGVLQRPLRDGEDGGVLDQRRATGRRARRLRDERRRRQRRQAAREQRRGMGGVEGA